MPNFNFIMFKNKAGKAKDHRGHAPYLIIQCTDNWKDEDFRAQAQGRVHDRLLRDVLGIDDYGKETNGEKRVCCSGFAYHKKEFKTSSIWLNKNNQIGCETDGSQYLSGAEFNLVNFCMDQWEEKTAVPGSVIEIDQFWEENNIFQISQQHV